MLKIVYLSLSELNLYRCCINLVSQFNWPCYGFKRKSEETCIWHIKSYHKCMFYEELSYRTMDGEPRTLTDEKTGFNWNEEHEGVKSHMHVSLINEMRCNTYRHALQTLLMSTFLPMFLFFVNIRTYYECNPNYYNQPKDVPISG